MIIHADYLMDAGVLKVIKKSDPFEDTNLDQVTLVMKMEKKSAEKSSDFSHYGGWY